MNELHLFAGAGGGILGGILQGHTCVCAVEINTYCQKILLQRQRDGILPRFPIWDDVKTFDGTPWNGKVDILCGGFPCQDISVAGKGTGITGERSGLWKHMARIIGEVRPRFVFIENSPMLRTRGLATVLKDLAEMGFDAQWGVVGAHHAGAPHKRDRMWILGYPNHHGLSATEVVDCIEKRVHASSTWTFKTSESSRPGIQHAQLADANGAEYQEQWQSESIKKKQHSTQRGSWWKAEPGVGRVADGMANRVDRLKSLGNGQVPAVVRLASIELTHALSLFPKA